LIPPDPLARGGLGMSRPDPDLPPPLT
jgi:hypothetical protein